jgi:hypothetical protein
MGLGQPGTRAAQGVVQAVSQIPEAVCLRPHTPQEHGVEKIKRDDFDSGIMQRGFCRLPTTWLQRQLFAEKAGS